MNHRGKNILFFNTITLQHNTFVPFMIHSDQKTTSSISNQTTHCWWKTYMPTEICSGVWTGIVNRGNVWSVGAPENCSLAEWPELTVIVDSGIVIVLLSTLLSILEFQRNHISKECASVYSISISDTITDMKLWMLWNLVCTVCILILSNFAITRINMAAVLTSEAGSTTLASLNVELWNFVVRC